MIKKMLTKLFAARTVSSPYPAFTGSGYSKPSVLNWYAPQKSAKTEVSEGQQQTLINRAWDAYRNQDIARAVVSQLKTSVVNTGLKVTPDISAENLGLNEDQEEELESKIVEEFEIWSNQCDIERTLDFEEIQLLLLTNWGVSGGILVNTIHEQYPGDLYSLKIQAIDIERLSNPYWGLDTKTRYRGIEMNEYGAPLSYHILDAHPSDIQFDPYGANHWTEISAYDDLNRRRLLHMFEKDRAGQPLGYSMFCSALPNIKNVGQYSENELIASLVASWMTIFIESPNPEMNLGFKKNKEDKRLPADSTGAFKDTVELGPGAIIELDSGKKINIANPQRPNANFDPYYKAMCRNISASLGLPLEEVLLIFNDSYSASRAAMLKAGKTFNRFRLTLIKKVLEYIYRLWFDEAVYRNNLPYISPKYWTDPRVRYAYQRHLWLAPGHGAIDEEAEARAATLRIKSSLSSLPDEAAKISGKNYKTIIRQQAKALKMLKKYGLPNPFEIQNDEKPSTEGQNTQLSL